MILEEKIVTFGKGGGGVKESPVLWTNTQEVGKGENVSVRSPFPRGIPVRESEQEIVPAACGLGYPDAAWVFVCFISASE